MLVEAERQGDHERVMALNTQLDAASTAYRKILTAYVTICRTINEERRAIITAQAERNRPLVRPTLTELSSGHA